MELEFKSSSKEVTFKDIKIGDRFWDESGELCRKVGETSAKFLDGDTQPYGFRLSDKVRTYP